MALYEEAAKKAGMSLNDFILTAIEEKIERDKHQSFNLTRHRGTK